MAAPVRPEHAMPVRSRWSGAWRDEPPVAVSVASVVLEMKRRFPGAVVWFGAATGHWWGLVWCGRWRLVEAWNPVELARALRAPKAWPWPAEPPLNVHAR